MRPKSKPFRPLRAEALDLDGNSEFQLLKAYFNARAMKKTVHVMSSPLHGFHVYAKEGFTLQEAMILSDCPGRIRYWELQGYTFTFHDKFRFIKVGINDYRKHMLGIEENYNPLSLPFFSRVERGWNVRRKRIEN